MKDPSFWIWGLIITQFLSAAAHSLSFFVKQKANNETEKQLLELITNYKADLGAGFKRSYSQLFFAVSICFTMIYTLGAVLNWYFLRSGISIETWRGLILIELISYGILFFIMIRFAFLPPIIVTGLVFIFAGLAYLFI